jgi:hypothetical protein
MVCDSAQALAVPDRKGTSTMAMRGWIGRIPIWVRVPGIIALVLVGVLVSTMLLTVSRDGGGHGSAGDHTQTSAGGHGSGGHGSGGGGHSTGTAGR